MMPVLLSDACAAEHNQHLAALVRDNWFEQMVCTPGAGKVIKGNRRTLLKEWTESYAVLSQLRQLELDQTEGGEQLVLFDVCSGKGLTSLMLSCAFP